MGLGFRRGSYKCLCRKGFYFPDIVSLHKFFNGSLLEEEYEKLMLVGFLICGINYHYHAELLKLSGGNGRSNNRKPLCQVVSIIAKA